MMGYNIEFYPYLPKKYIYIFFFISISGRIRIRSIFPAEADPDPWKKMSDPHPCMLYHVRKPFSLVVYRTPLAV